MTLPYWIFLGLLVCAVAGLFYSTLYWLRRYQAEREEVVRLRASVSGEDVLLKKVEGMAASALKENAETFLNLAQTTLQKEASSAKSDLEKKHLEFEKTIEPIRMTLDRYQKELSQLEEERRKSYNSVEQGLKSVTDMAKILSAETTNLKNALKRPHVRGRWGEVQLRNCIELAGMSEFADVTFQDSQTDDDGQRLIPDMTVRMPGGRVIVVDAKTPIEAFIAALETTDEEARQTEMLRHGRHVKDHVKKLSTRAYYEGLKNSPDFTVMFLPNESFLYAALESEPDLVEFALQRKILVATPPTLIGLLKVIRYGWNEEKLGESASKISETGTELHKRICDFIDAFTGIGKALDKAKSEYDTGLARLQRRILPQAKKLEKLGAKSAKSLGLDADGSDPDSGLAELEAAD